MGAQLFFGWSVWWFRRSPRSPLRRPHRLLGSWCRSMALSHTRSVTFVKRLISLMQRPFAALPGFILCHICLILEELDPIAIVTSNQHTHCAVDHFIELFVFVEAPHLSYINVRFVWKRRGVRTHCIMPTYFCTVLQVENNPAWLTPSKKVVPTCWARRDSPPTSQP